MGKFYVEIRLNSTNYKVRQDDVQRVHSRPQRTNPALPVWEQSDDAKMHPTLASLEEWAVEEQSGGKEPQR